MSAAREVFVSVDVETAGPIPGEFSLPSIGACAVDNVTATFACELQPINRNADPKALELYLQGRYLSRQFTLTSSISKFPVIPPVCATCGPGSSRWVNCRTTRKKSSIGTSKRCRSQKPIA